MRFHVTFRFFNNFLEPKSVKAMRKVLGAQMQTIAESGKMVDGGAFGDWRGGYMILDVASALEMHELLGAAFLDHCEVDAHPILTFPELGELLERISNSQ